MSKPLHVGILFSGVTWGSSFSLAGVVRQHAATLTSHGVKTRLIVRQGLEPPQWMPETVDYQAIVPPAYMPAANDDRFADGPEIPNKDLANLLWATMRDLDWVMTHDLLAMKRYTALRAACYSLAKNHPKLLWMHILHFNTEQLKPWQEMHSFSRWHFAQSFCACLTKSQILPTADRFDIPVSQVVSLDNVRSLKTIFGISNRISKAIDVDALASSDVLIVHPFSLDRSAIKQPFHTLFIAKALQDFGKQTHIIFADPMTTQPKSYMNHRIPIKWLANALGLQQENFTYMSENPATQQGLTALEMSELYRIANVFVHSSFSEGGPLAVIEAMAHGNLCVLNAKVPAFRDTADENAIYHPFCDLRDGQTEDTAYNILGYYQQNTREYADLAWQISDAIDNNPILSAKKKAFQTYCSGLAAAKLPATLFALKDRHKSSRPVSNRDHLN